MLVNGERRARVNEGAALRKVKGGSNAYRYVFNNPVNLVDPDGLAAQSPGWTAEPRGGREGPLRDESGRPIMLADASGMATGDALGRMRADQQLRDARKPRSIGWLGAALPATSQMLGNPPPPGYTEFVHDTVNPFVVRMAQTEVAMLGALGGFSGGISLMATSESLGGFALGAGLTLHTTDNLQATLRNEPTFTSQAIGYATGSPTAGEVGNMAVGLGLNTGAAFHLAAPANGQPFINRLGNSAIGTARAGAFNLAVEAAHVDAVPQLPRPAFTLKPLHPVQLNATRGSAFETFGMKALALEKPGGIPQLAIRPFLDDGTIGDHFFRIDALRAFEPTLTPGTTAGYEFKSSLTAPLSPNQRWGFPLFDRNGGVVVGQMGEPALPAGTVLPPTPVRVIRFDRFGSNPIRGDERW